MVEPTPDLAAIVEEMFATPPELTLDGASVVVRVWYGDGDLAAEVYGNLGLDIDAEELAKALLAPSAAAEEGGERG